MRDEQGKQVDTRNMPHGQHLLSWKGGKGFPKMRCQNPYLNISHFPERMSSCSILQQMLCFENIGQCCPASFGGKKVWSTHRKREDKDVLQGYLDFRVR